MSEIYFYGKDEAYGEFSNFSPYGIEMNQVWWPTVEHYFQSQKFSDSTYQEKIRLASTPKIAAELGRSRRVKILPNWEEIKRHIMYQAVLKKFQTHGALSDMLLETGNATIIEGSLNDYYWGCGQEGSGRNELGKIIMEVRGQLLKDKTN